MSAFKKVNNMVLFVIILVISGLYYINKNPLNLPINFNYSEDIVVSSDKISITYSDFKIKVSSQKVLITKINDSSFDIKDVHLDIDLWLLTSSFSANLSDAEVLPLVHTNFAKYNKIKFNGYIKANLLLLKPQMIEMQLTSSNGYITPESTSLEEIKLDNFLLSLVYKSNKLSVKNLSLGYNNGINAKLSGDFTIDNNKVSSAVFKAEVNDLPINYLKYLWPELLFPNIQNWVTMHISEGIIHKAHGDFKITKDALSKTILPKEALYSKIEVSGAQLNFLDSYSPIHDLTGTVVFDGEELRVNADNAKFKKSNLSDLKLTLLFKNLTLNLNNNFKGDIVEFNEFIPEELFQKFQKYDINLSKAKGSVEGDLKLEVKIRDVFLDEYLSFNIQADVSNLSLGKHKLLNLKKGKFELTKIPNQTTAKLNDNNILFVKVAQYYGHKQKKENYVELTSTINISEKINLNAATLENGVAKINAKVTSDTWQSKIDLSDAKTYFTHLGYTKPKKTSLTIDCSGNIQQNSFASENCQIAGEPHFSGLAKFNYNLEEKKLTQFSLDDIKIGNNKFSFNMVSENNLDTYTLNAQVIDIRQIKLEDFKLSNQSLSGSLLNLKINKLICHNDIILKNITALFRKDINKLADIQLSVASGDDLFTISRATKNAKNIYVVYSKNFATFTQAFNLYKNIKKGEAWVEITPHKTPKGTEYTANFQLHNFAFTNTSIITKVILGLLAPINSLDAVVKSLQGGSLPAELFTGDIYYKSSVLTLKNGHIIGPSYAIRMNGYIDLNKKFLKFKGLYIPFMYGINKIVASIPILGKLINGGEDSALIGANFKIRGDLKKPETEFNPFSILTPGFLRKIL